MGIHRAIRGQIIAPRGGKSFRRLPPTQICRRRTLCYPRQLRGMVHLRLLGPYRSRFSQQTKVNKQTIESLGSRVEALVKSLCAPTSEGDFKEGARRKKLAR